MAASRERYIQTDTPWRLVDGRHDVAACDLMREPEMTPHARAATALDNLDGLVWPAEYQRKLAIDEMVRGFA